MSSWSQLHWPSCSILGNGLKTHRSLLAVSLRSGTAAWPGATSAPPCGHPRDRPQRPQSGGSKGIPAPLRAQSRDKDPRGARNCPGNLCARTRKRGAGEDWAKGLAAEGGVYPSSRPTLPRGWTRAPPISLGWSVPSSTRPAARSPAPPPPLPPLHKHPCTPPAFVRRCSRQWEHPGTSAAERRSGRRRWRRRWSRSSHGWDQAGGRQKGGEALSPSRGGVGPEGGGAGSALAGGGGPGAGLVESLVRSPGQPGLRRCICIRSSLELSTLETTAIPWAASRMSPSRWAVSGSPRGSDRGLYAGAKTPCPRPTAPREAATCW